MYITFTQTAFKLNDRLCNINATISSKFVLAPYMY